MRRNGEIPELLGGDSLASCDGKIPSPTQEAPNSTGDTVPVSDCAPAFGRSSRADYGRQMRTPSLSELAAAAAWTSASAATRLGWSVLGRRRPRSEAGSSAWRSGVTRMRSPRSRCFHLRPHRSATKTCRVDSQFGLSTTHTNGASHRRARRLLCVGPLAGRWRSVRGRCLAVAKRIAGSRQPMDRHSTYDRT